MIPEKDELLYIELEYASNITFQAICFKDFIFILFSILKEKHVLFLSKDMRLLSAVVMCF